MRTPKMLRWTTMNNEDGSMQTGYVYTPADRFACALLPDGKLQLLGLLSHDDAVLLTQQRPCYPSLIAYTEAVDTITANFVRACDKLCQQYDVPVIYVDCP